MKPDIDCDRDMVPVTKFEIILHLGLMAVREPRKRYPHKINAIARTGGGEPGRFPRGWVAGPIFVKEGGR